MTEWGPWIDWGCKRQTGPSNIMGKYVNILYLDRSEAEGVVSTLNAENWAGVVKYRIRKDKGQEKDQRTQKGMDILKEYFKATNKRIGDSMMHWFDKEVDLLEKDLDLGLISWEEYSTNLRELQYELESEHEEEIRRIEEGRHWR